MRVAAYVISGTHPFRLIFNKGSVLSFENSNGSIVNAANTRCLGGGGVDGAISAAGGERLFKDRVALPVISSIDGENIRCPVGNAKLTGPGNYGELQVPYVIHAVGPSYFDYDDRNEADELLKSAYIESLNRAKEAQVGAIGFSLISSGVFRGSRSLKAVVRIAVQAVVEYGGYDELEEIHFFAFNEPEQSALFYAAGKLGLEST